jgi:hypothetical protein
MPGQSLSQGSASNWTSKGSLHVVNRVTSTDGKYWTEQSSPVKPLLEPSKYVLPIEGTIRSPQASTSTVSNYHTASNTPVLATADIVHSWSKCAELPPPQVHVESDDPNRSNDDAHNVSDGSLGAADKLQAQRIFDEIEDEAEDCEPAAAWLGNPDRALVRKAYMEFFDWSNMNILAALRSLCSKITLKGETQQVDRVLEAFSSRWCECNPNHGFKATGMFLVFIYWKREGGLG